MIDFGVTAAEFRARHLERSPYCKRGAVSERPFDWRMLDELLHHIEPTPAMMQMIHDGVVPQEQYVEDVVDLGMQRRVLNKNRFYALLQNGATLVTNRLELHSVAASRACAEIGRFVGQTTLCNSYLSFGGPGSFGKHWDTHDVFALQFIGSKRWQVFAPTLNHPLSHQTSNVMPPASEPPVLEIVLNPGDMLYIPRGWWHQVFPLQQASFHLSIGAYLPTVHDFITWACNRLLPQREAARRGIGGAADVPRDVAAALQFLGEALRTPAHLEEFLQQLAGRQHLSADFNLGLMADPASSGLAGSAGLRLTSRSAVRFEAGEMSFNGERLALDRVTQEIVLAIANNDACTVEGVCQKLKKPAREEVHARILELAKRDIVSIDAA